MAEPTKQPKRLNRVVGVAEAISGALDPALRKRGFATRDIIAQWPVIVPSPYDVNTFPDKLSWPRGNSGSEGATLWLRCAPGHALAASHEGPRIAAAVNRYFGYLLVASVRLTAEPFTPRDTKPVAPPQASPEAKAAVGLAVADVQDEGLREALRQLGDGIMARNHK